MRYTCTLLLLCFLVPSAGICQAPPEFITYAMGGANSAEFTTNNFKCIAAGKDNVVWAGTQYGGLYMYSPTFNIWRKSTKLTNVFINDIKADADSGIWVAQSGQASVGGNSSIAGGVNYFPVGSDISMEFYSVAGTTTSADLLSRNAKGLYIDQSFKAAGGDLPRPWVIQGTYITSFNTRRGGVNIGLNRFTPYFTNIPGGFSSQTSATPICEAIGGNSQEVWVGVRQNGPAGSQILRYMPSGIFKGVLDTVGSKIPAGFTAQAIHFDAAGNRWIGLKAGGLFIKTPNGWKTMNSESLLPPGTQINFNAITSDEYGNVYIGTSNGLLEYLAPDYHPSSSPDYTPSYNLYTTDDGLPSNNITGLGYDKKNGKVLITSAGGVTFMNKREEFIRGVVYDVFTNIDSTNNPYSGFQKQPLNRGVTTVRLLKDNVEEEFVYPDANGQFELKEANETDVYTVEVKYVRDGKTMRYIYNNVRNHTLMEPVLFPDSLIGEIKAYIPKLEKRCFPFKLYFQVEVNPSLLCTDAFNAGKAFNTNNYDDAIDPFYDISGISVNHRKKVDNLGTYYASLATVYNLGGHVVDLTTDAVSNLFDAVESLRGFIEFGYSLKYPGNADPLETVDEEVFAGAVAAIKVYKDGIIVALTKSSSLIKDADAKKTFDKCVSSLNEVADVAIEAMENGRNQAILKVFLDHMKRILAVGVAIDYYREDYAQDRHRYFVQEAALSAYGSQSEYSYTETYDNLVNPESNSLAKYAKDTLDLRKATISTLADVARYAEMASNALDAATALALVPGGQIAATIAKGLSLVAKGTKTGALAAAMYQGAVGASQIATLSETIMSTAGFDRPVPGSNSGIFTVAQNAPDSLVARKNRYNQRLTELQAIYNAPVYNETAYKNKRRQFKVDDSLYSAELLNTLNALWASTDTAVARVPGFTNKLNRVVDSFVTRQYTLRHSLYFQNIAWVYEANKTLYAPGLDSLANEIKLANDSAVNGIAWLIDEINNNSIGAPAYLVQETYRINHSRVPGSTGTITYTFKNYGAEAQNNVSFKINKPTAGYTITGSDSVNVGTIAPGQVKLVSFTFQSPMHDSVSNYIIDVKAANGSYKDVYGAFYVIDPSKFYTVKNGNWNDPATWSTNTVPAAANSVYISHTVTVNVDATCKTAMVYKPGNVVVNTGRKFTVLQ